MSPFVIAISGNDNFAHSARQISFVRNGWVRRDKSCPREEKQPSGYAVGVADTGSAFTVLVVEVAGSGLIVLVITGVKVWLTLSGDPFASSGSAARVVVSCVEDTRYLGTHE